MDQAGYYQLKMYWTSSYDWKIGNEKGYAGTEQDSSHRHNSTVSNVFQRDNKAWCAACKNAGCDRGSVVLVACDSTDRLQRWRASSFNGDKLKTHVNDDGCFSYFEPGRMTIKPCADRNDDHQLVRLKSFSGGHRFQIQAINKNHRCVSSYPYNNDNLRLISCDLAVTNEAAFWVTGRFDAPGHHHTDDVDDDHDDPTVNDNYDDDVGPNVPGDDIFDDHDDDDSRRPCRTSVFPRIRDRVAALFQTIH